MSFTVTFGNHVFYTCKQVTTLMSGKKLFDETLKRLKQTHVCVRLLYIKIFLCCQKLCKLQIIQTPIERMGLTFVKYLLFNKIIV